MLSQRTACFLAFGVISSLPYVLASKCMSNVVLPAKHRGTVLCLSTISGIDACYRHQSDGISPIPQRASYEMYASEDCDNR